MNAKITVVMPTYNRAECINYYIEHSIKPYKGKLFCFEIHDSSTDDKTQDYVQKANELLYNKIKYFRYESTINGDNKTHKALANVKTDYIYLIGDGFCPNYNELENILLNNNFDKYDLLGLFNKSFKYNKAIKLKYKQNDIIYAENDLNYIFENLVLCFTLYGASIVSTKMFDYIEQNNFFEKFEFNGRYSFAYCLSCIESLTSNKFSTGVCYTDCIDGNPNKKGNWAHDEIFHSIFYEEFITDFDKVSYLTLEQKNKSLKNIGKYHFTYGGIIQKKRNNIFKIKYLKKYKTYIKRCNNHYWFIWLVSITPMWMINIVYYPLKGCKKLLKKILRRD